MTRADTLRALAERVERGETGREINVAVHAMFASVPPRGGPAFTPRYTTSIDAQAALGVLPDTVYHVTRDGSVYCANIWDENYMRLSTGTASTEPAARLAAILRALAERE